MLALISVLLPFQIVSLPRWVVGSGWREGVDLSIPMVGSHTISCLTELPSSVLSCILLALGSAKSLCQVSCVNTALRQAAAEAFRLVCLLPGCATTKLLLPEVSLDSLCPGCQALQWRCKAAGCTLTAYSTRSCKGTDSLSCMWFGMRKANLLSAATVSRSQISCTLLAAGLLVYDLCTALQRPGRLCDPQWGPA